MGKAFRKRHVVKIYHALVAGWLSCPQGNSPGADCFLDIDVPIRDNGPYLEHRDRSVASEWTGQTDQARDDLSTVGKAESASTRIWPLQKGYIRGARCTFAKIQIRSGRRHQIRVHLDHIGHPILGDTIYGENNHQNASIFRMFLHAHHLSLPLQGLSYTAE